MSRIEFEEENYSISIVDDYILDIKINDFMEIQKEDLISMQRWVRENTSESNLINFVQFGNGSTATREAREYAASPEGNAITIGSAILVKNLAQQLIIDYYLKFNNPLQPTKVFYKKANAEKWMKSLLESVQ